MANCSSKIPAASPVAVGNKGRDTTYPHFKTRAGYITQAAQKRYIDSEVSKGRLPKEAHRMAHIVSLDASNDPTQRIFFWQLFSVLGEVRVEKLVRQFYERVFADTEDHKFRKAFSDLSGIDHHVWAQSMMWMDAFGGGPKYHGGEYRLQFHHQHNAMQVLNRQGAERWVKHMVDTLNSPKADLTSDPRVRVALNDFLGFYMDKYAKEFCFDGRGLQFGNATAKLNFLTMTEEDIGKIPTAQLKEALIARGVDVSQCLEKEDLVKKALNL